MRILDADALILHLDYLKFQESHDHCEPGDPAILFKTLVVETLKQAIKAVEGAATVDIVTCGQCKYCERESAYEQTPYGFENEVTDKYVYCTKHHDEDGEVLDVRLDDFCSWAERRDDGGR